MTPVATTLLLPVVLLAAQPGPGPGQQTQTPALLNVRDFGAKGDGKTDDTAAIQAAIDVLASDGVARGQERPGRHILRLADAQHELAGQPPHGLRLGPELRHEQPVVSCAVLGRPPRRHAPAQPLRRRRRITSGF